MTLTSSEPGATALLSFAGALALLGSLELEVTAWLSTVGAATLGSSKPGVAAGSSVSEVVEEEVVEGPGPPGSDWVSLSFHLKAWVGSNLKVPAIVPPDAGVSP